MSGSTTENVIFPVTLSRALSVPVTVHYATSDNTAVAGADYTSASGTVTFPPGVTAQTISIQVMLLSTHSVTEKDFRLTLNSPVNALLGNATQQTFVVSIGSTVTSTVPVIVLMAPSISAREFIPLSPLSAVGNQFVDAMNNKVRLRGFNWYGCEGTNILPHGLYTKGVGYKDILNFMAELGFNFLRLPFADEMLTSTLTFGTVGGPQFIDVTANPDLIGKTPLQAIDIILAYAYTVGIRVLLDQHRISINPIIAGDSGYGTDGWPAANPAPATPTAYTVPGGTYTLGAWQALWGAVATHFTAGQYAIGGACYGVIMGFDPHNEPFNLKWSVWKVMVQDLCAIVHAIAPQWMVLVEGVWKSEDGTDLYWFGGYLKEVATSPIVIARQNKVAYEAHDYNTDVSQQPWLQSVTPLHTVTNWPNNLEAIFDQYWGFIYKQDIAPLLIGEFGGRLGFDGSGNADPTQTNGPVGVQWFQKLVQYMDCIRNDGTNMFLQAGDRGISFSIFAINPESIFTTGGTQQGIGGLLCDDYITLQKGKFTLMQPLFKLSIAVTAIALPTTLVVIGQSIVTTQPTDVTITSGTASALTYLTAGATGVFGQGNVLFDTHGTPFVQNFGDWYGMESPILCPNGMDHRPYKTVTIGGVTHLGLLDQFKAAGFNGLRYGVCEDIAWSTISGSPVGWSITNGRRPTGTYVDPVLNADLFNSPNDYSNASIKTCLEILDLIVAHCSEIGLYIMLDMHCLAPSASDQTGNSRTVPVGTLDGSSSLGQTQPNWVVTKLWYTTVNRTDVGSNAGVTCEYRNEQQAIDFWVAMAKRYVGKPAVAFFDIINEPAGGSWAATRATDDINTSLRIYYETVGNLVLAQNPGICIVCEGPSNWRPGMSINIGPVPAGYPGGNTGDHSNDVFLFPGFSAAMFTVGANPVVLSVPGKVVMSPHDYPGHGLDGYNSLNTANRAAWGVTAQLGYGAWFQYDPTFPSNMAGLWSQSWGYLAEKGLFPLFIGEIGSDLTCDVITTAGTGVAGATGNTVQVLLRANATPTVGTACTWNITSGTSGTSTQNAISGTAFVAASGSFTWTANKSIQTIPLTLLPGALPNSQFQISFTLGGATQTDTGYIITTPNIVSNDLLYFAALRNYMHANSIGWNWFSFNPEQAGAPYGLLTIEQLVDQVQGAYNRWTETFNSWQMSVVQSLFGGIAPSKQLTMYYDAFFSAGDMPAQLNQTTNYLPAKVTNARLAKIPCYVKKVIISFAHPNCTYVQGTIATLSFSNFYTQTRIGWNDSALTMKAATDLLRGRNPGCKVLLGVGGAGADASYGGWASAKYQALVDLVNDMNWDGILIDYEPASYNYNCTAAPDGTVSCLLDGTIAGIVNSFRAVMPRSTGKLLELYGGSTACYAGPYAAGLPVGSNSGSLVTLSQSAAGALLDGIHLGAYDAASNYDPEVALSSYLHYWPNKPVYLGVRTRGADSAVDIYFTVTYLQTLSAYVQQKNAAGIGIYSMQWVPYPQNDTISPTNPPATSSAQPSADTMAQTIAAAFNLPTPTKTLWNDAIAYTP